MGEEGDGRGSGGVPRTAHGMGWMLSVQVTVRTGPDRIFGDTVTGSVRHRVPAAANRATEETFDLVTNAGPVSTGAAPPPLTLPLVRYSQRASTAR